MTSSRKLCRRSFLACVTGGAPFLVLARAAAAQQPAEPPPSTPEERRPGRTPVHDSDKGQNTDNWNIGGARGVGRARVAQCSDRDSGPGADPLGESHDDSPIRMPIEAKGPIRQAGSARGPGMRR